MSYTTKNYHDDGGDKFVVGGTLEVTAEGQITKDGQPVVIAPQMPHLDPATASAADIANALIAAGYTSAS